MSDLVLHEQLITDAEFLEHNGFVINGELMRRAAASLEHLTSPAHFVEMIWAFEDLGWDAIGSVPGTINEGVPHNKLGWFLDQLPEVHVAIVALVDQRIEEAKK